MVDRRRLPNNIRDEIHSRVFQLADDEGYLTNSRTQNANFIERLVQHPEVGRVLAEFMEDRKVRVYIKDAILNRYAKARRNVDPERLPTILADRIGGSVAKLEEDESVFLFCSTNGDFLVVGLGTLVKWETALRKLLLFIGRKPQLCAQRGSLKKFLIVTSGDIPLRPGDEELLVTSLRNIGVDIIVV